MNKSNIGTVFGILLISLLGCSEAEQPASPESPAVSSDPDGPTVSSAQPVTPESSAASSAPAGSTPSSGKSGADFVGLWQVKKVCEPTHQTDGHGNVGSKSRTPHARKDGWYAIYPKRKDGSEIIYGIMISEEFADYSVLPELINWNKIELRFTPAEDPELPTGPFDCQGPPGDVSLLTSLGGNKDGPVLHDETQHVVQIYLHANSAEHPGETAPVISFRHSGGSTLHNGVLH